VAHKLTPHVDAIREMAANGATKVDVAAKFSVDESSVRRLAARHGIAFDSTLARAARPVDDLSHDIDDPTEVPVIVRDYSHLDSMYVYPLGDVHIGAATHQSARWREWLGYLAGNDRTSMLGTGDFLNCAIIGAKSDVYEERATVGDAKRTLRGELKPLAEQGRLDVLMPGNHENRVTRATGDCPVQDVAEWLGVPYARAAAWLVYRVGDVEYDFYVRHGTGNGQSTVALKKGAMVATADVFVTGHVHNQTVTADEIFTRDGDRVVRKRRYYVSSGSFLAAEGYALERGYSPTRIGAPRIYLDGRRKDVHASI
jgi:hypothetical protein